MVSAWGAISQQAGIFFSRRAPLSPPPTLIPLLPRSSWRAHDIVAHPPLVSHPSFYFRCSHISWSVVSDAYFHIQVAPSQTILEIRIRRGGISIQGHTVWAVPGSPHFYAMHECGSLPSATDGNLHTPLPRRLAHSGPVRVGFDIAQDPPPQPLRLPGAQGQFCQEHTVTQPTSFIPGHSYLLNADDRNCLSEASHDDSVPRSFLRGRYRPSVQSFPENAGPYGSGFAGTSVGSASHATHPVLAEAEDSIRGLASQRWLGPVYQPWPLAKAYFNIQSICILHLYKYNSLLSAKHQTFNLTIRPTWATFVQWFTPRACMLLCIKFNDIQHRNYFINKIKYKQTCIYRRNASIRLHLELNSPEDDAKSAW